MVFLTPLFLVGLLAAAIPVAIHLIRREKPPKLMFSSIRFMKKTSRKLVLFQQLQQIFLLLLRSALIALLVIAFARPLVNQSVARLLDSDPESAVILFDTSMSMAYGEVFDRARQEALQILDDMVSGDEVALVAFAEGPELVRELDTDVDRVRSVVQGFQEPGYGSTNFMPALQLADQMLEQSQFENRVVYLVSDFQDNAADAIEAGWKLGPGVQFRPIDVGNDETRNLALTDVRVPEQLLEQQGDYEILARVRSTGSFAQQQGQVRLLINEQVVDQQEIDLTDQSEQVLTFATEFDSEGTYIGELRLLGDEFETDNSFHFAVSVLPRIRVLAINGESSANWFDDEGHWFGLAISGSASSPFDLQSIEPAEVSAAALRQADVAVLLNVGDLSNAQADALQGFVQDGGALLIAPGDRVDPQVYNRQFADITPGTLGLRNDLGNNDYLVIAEYDRRHPALRPLNTDWTARFQSHWQISPAPDAQVLMQFDNTEPALLERNAGQGKVMLLASPLDLEWNNLALQGLFLPFVHETLTHLVQGEIAQSSFAVGSSFPLAPGNAINVSAFDATGAPVVFDNERFVLTANRPGVIRAEIETQAGNSARVFAVNSMAAESNLARGNPDNLFDSIINPDTDPVQSREVQTARLAEELERPQRLWWWIIALAMLIFIAEGFIANRTYR